VFVGVFVGVFVVVLVGVFVTALEKQVSDADFVSVPPNAGVALSIWIRYELAPLTWFAWMVKFIED